MNIPYIDYNISLSVITKFNLDDSEQPYNFIGGNIVDYVQPLYNFYQGILINHPEPNINKAIFYFVLSENLDAFAASDANGYKIIGITIGAFTQLRGMFMNGPILDDHRLKGFLDVQEKSSELLQVLMYQTCEHFIFYHELGHLIQGNVSGKVKFTENVTVNKGTVMNDHMSEVDADMYATNFIAQHIFQYISSNCQTMSSHEIEYIIAISSAALFILFLSFPGADQGVYYEESTHPHSIIRIVLVVSSIIDGLKSKNLDAETFNVESIINKTLDSLEVFTTFCIPDLDYKDFKNYFSSEKSNIFAYSRKLRSLVVKWDESAVVRSGLIEN